MNNIQHYYVANPNEKVRRQQPWLGIVLGITVSLLAAGTYQNYTATHAPAGTLKRLIQVGEAGSRGYNSYNRGSMRCTKSNSSPLKLTSMTIGEIQYYQSLPSCSPNKLLAVGHYQIIPETLNRAVRELGIPKSAMFTPNVQDTIFAHYLAKEKQPAIHRWVSSGQDLHSASYAVAQEWAIFKAPNGRGLYDGKGTNKARISAVQVRLALEKARQDYMRLTLSGYTTEDAYARALGVHLL